MAEAVAQNHTQTAVVGRQAIFDSQMKVFAYELLYRDGRRNCANFLDGDEATAKVMVNTFLELGINQLTGDAKAFINFTEKLLLNHVYEALPPNLVVLEVLENIEPTPAILEALGQAKEKGFQIALDDFIMKDSHSGFLELADFVKIDVLAVPPDEIPNQLKYFQPYPIKILAEKVEDRWVFEECLKLGFEFFQGYFFCKPQIVEGVSLSSIGWLLSCCWRNSKTPSLRFMT